MVAREHGNIHRSRDFGPAPLVRLLERCDAFRKPQRFGEVLLACEYDVRGRMGLHDSPCVQRQRLPGVLLAAQSVVTSTIAKQAQRNGLDIKKIGELIHAARVCVVGTFEPKAS